MKKFAASDLTSRRILEVAFQRRSVELLECLLRSGFKFNKKTLGERETFLYLAIDSNWTVDMLSNFCDLDEIKVSLPGLVGVRDNRGATPFASAVIKGHFAVADYLAKLSPQQTSTADAQTFVLDSGHDAYSSIFPFGWPCVTLLGYCLGATADEGLKVQQVKYLLQFQPAFRISQTHGCTALALCWKDWKYHQERFLSPKLESCCSSALLDILLQHYSEKGSVNQADYLGNTPLHYACASGHVHGVQRLLEAGADVNALDHGGMTPLDVVKDQGYFVLQHGQRRDGDYSAFNPNETLQLFEAVQLEVSVFFELHELLSATGGLPDKACLKAKKKPVSGPECRLAEDCHRVKVALWKQFGGTRPTRQPGSIHIFLLEQAQRKPPSWTKPIELADSDAESFLAATTQPGSASTAARSDDDEDINTEKKNIWKHVNNFPDLKVHLAKARWCARIHSLVVNRAINQLKEIGVMTKNRGNRKAAQRNQQLRCTKTAQQIQEALARHPRVETGLRRLIARLAADLVADSAATSLFGKGRRKMEREENQLELLRIRAMARRKFLRELNEQVEGVDMTAKALAAIL